jgi:hypothetical protein
VGHTDPNHVDPLSELIVEAHRRRRAKADDLVIAVVSDGMIRRPNRVVLKPAAATRPGASIPATGIEAIDISACCAASRSMACGLSLEPLPR